LGDLVSYVIYTTVIYSQAGWVRFDGSQERMNFGEDCHFKVGDEVKITFQKVQKDAKDNVS
jgi:hypothetical protein